MNNELKGLDNYITSGRYYEYEEDVTCKCGHTNTVRCFHEYGMHWFCNEDVKCEECGEYLMESEIRK